MKISDLIRNKKFRQGGISAALTAIIIAVITMNAVPLRPPTNLATAAAAVLKKPISFMTTDRIAQPCLGITSLKRDVKILKTKLFFYFSLDFS